jgi:hypothetical protein
MNNEKDIKAALNLANELQGKMNELLNLTNKSFESLPVEEQGKVAFVAQDINGIMKAAKNGDLEQLQQYITKYADSNNK